jgi:diguanylate cyclase (GGDEF)-like protein/PAS domain S-box-containing protein
MQQYFKILVLGDENQFASELSSLHQPFVGLDYIAFFADLIVKSPSNTQNAKLPRADFYVYKAHDPADLVLVSLAVQSVNPAAFILLLNSESNEANVSEYCMQLPNIPPAALHDFLLDLNRIGKQRARYKNILRMYHTTLEYSSQGIILTDCDWQLIYANSAFSRLYGIDPGLLQAGNSLQSILRPAEMNYLRNTVLKNLTQGTPWHGELATSRQDATKLYTEVSLHQLPDGVYIITFSDITKQKIAYLQLRKHSDLYRRFYENAKEGYFQCALDGTFLSANPRFLEMCGYEDENELFTETPLSSHMYGDPVARQKLLTNLIQGDAFICEVEEQLRNKSDAPLWVRERIHLIRTAEGTPTYFEIIVENITEQKRTEDNLLEIAYKDSLTGLPNRIGLHTDLQNILRKNRKHLQKDPTHEFLDFGLLLSDLDRFKVINDSLGPNVGDLLIKAVGQRIQQLLQNFTLPNAQSPAPKLYRIGGDSFAIFLNVPNCHKALEILSGEICRLFKEPFFIDGHEAFTTISIGWVSSSIGYKSPELYIRAADTAMSEVKKEGGDGWKVFIEEMHEKVHYRLKVEENLRKGLKQKDQFHVHFQPIISARQRRVVGAEALVRWMHPTEGLISPVDFIPIAEETGLIRELGHKVLLEACRQAGDWIRNGLSDFFISVNVSMHQLQVESFYREVEDILDRTGLPPRCLKLEITESLAMTSLENTLKLVGNLRKLGIEFSIDDFGTGYSSLAYLQQLPFHSLKIDRIFVKDLDTAYNATTMVNMIRALAQSLGLQVIAEGVEEKSQLDKLIALGIDRFQGFYFSRPVPAQEFEVFLQEFPNSSTLEPLD